MHTVVFNKIELEAGQKIGFFIEATEKQKKDHKEKTGLDLWGYVPNCAYVYESKNIPI